MKKIIFAVIVAVLALGQTKVFSQNTNNVQATDTTRLLETDTKNLAGDSLLNEDSLEKDLPSFRDTLVLPASLNMMDRINDSIHKTRKYHGHLLISDSPLVHALDSLAYVKFYKRGFLIEDTASEKNSKFKPGQIPVYPDSVYAKRIAILNAETPIELVYNKPVKAFIHLYAVKKRLLTEKVLGLSEIYFPMIEQLLDQYNLPLELKYLAVVESALNPAAGSDKGAKGLWQFMYGTGKIYGLKVTSLVDDRYNPYKATVAAVKYLKDLYSIYGSWSLALAAYNSGTGSVNRAIRRAGGTKNYWAIWPFLPRETREYVPAFIAVDYIMHYATAHNLYPMRPGIFYYDIDTVTVHDVLSFGQLHEMLGIPLDELKFLNPQFKLGIIPAVNGKTYTLRIPRQFTDDFLNNEKALYAFKTKRGIAREKLLAEIKRAGNRDIVIVRSGENLGFIARRYHVYISQLMRWNRLRSSRIYPRQRLIVYGADSRQFYQRATAPITRSKTRIIYTVRSGENLGLIARRYHVYINQLMRWNRLRSSRIYPRQRLIVYGADSRQFYQRATAPITRSKTRIIYTVRSGESLGLIARKYRCTPTDLKEWNNLRSSRIYPGQKLYVYKPVYKSKNTIKSGKFVYHVIKPGDTLWDIAKEYDGVTVEQIKRLNHIRNSRHLQPGQRLKIAEVS